MSDVLVQANGMGLVMKKLITNLRKEDVDLDLKPAPWTQDEVDAMHEMVKKYIWAEQFKKRAAHWIVWGLGIPATIWYFVEPLERLVKFVRGIKG